MYGRTAQTAKPLSLLTEFLTERNKNERRWWYSDSFSIMQALEAWQILPSEFGLCDPEEDLYLMTAYKQNQAIMREWDAFMMRQKNA